MKKFVLIVTLIIVMPGLLLAQKPPLGYDALKNWPSIYAEKISNDGKYVLYEVESGKSGIWAIESADLSFKKEISGAFDASFTNDGRRVIVKLKGDSLEVLDLYSNHLSVIPAITSFKLPEADRGQWLAYLLKSHELILTDLYSGERKVYPDVKDYQFSPSGKVLLTNSTMQSGPVQWINTSSGKAITIWHGTVSGDFALDPSETQLAFINAGNKQAQPENTIWYYKVGTDSASQFVNSRSEGMEQGFAIKNTALKFSPNGDKLFFDLYHKKDTVEPDQNAAGVDVWNYKDEFLQPEQLAGLEGNVNRLYRSVVILKDNKVVRLEQEKDGLWGRPELNEGGNDDYCLDVTKINTMMGYQSAKERPDVYLVNTSNGLRTWVKRRLFLGLTHFSPAGHYVIWYDEEKRAYFAYDIRDGRTRNISAKLSVSLGDEMWDEAVFPREYGICTWLKNDQAVLIYDRYDIWKLDPAGVKAPVNVTNGYGRRNRITLRYVSKDPYRASESAVQPDTNLIICGLNDRSKKNGFLELNLGQKRDPKVLLFSSQLFYYFTNGLSEFDDPSFLIKAKQANAFLIKRMSTTEYPNLQLTTDFRTFKAMSNLQPQKKYNWLTDELVHYKTFDGRPGEGILYKPEDFDPHKKYPIIFYMYERLSDGLNRYMNAGFSEGAMNIPWFVSHGYLVFCPDIHYIVGEPGESVYNYVVSAAKMMQKKPWVDGTHMGIQGHSWGGYEVNCLITRTDIFEAAASADGPTDFVSDYGSVPSIFGDQHAFLENAQPRMGKTLWQNPGAYIKNSPVFGAKKVNSPLLILHSKGDPVVPWAQGVEFFTDLRRLGKKVWMLQYDGGGHEVSGDASKDYTIRLGQFFDHYLKGAPAPVWMTRGVPARLKGIDNGLELDSSGAKP